MSSITDRIRTRLGALDSPHRQIAQGFLWVSLFVFLGKLAGAGKEMTIAWRYGVSETVDAYVFIFNLVTWPVAIWFNILIMVLVPLATRLRHGNPAELPRFRAELLGLTLLISLTLGLLTWFALPALLHTGWLGLSGKALSEALHMSGGLALLAPLGTSSALFSVWLLAAGRHRNTLFEAIPALTLLAFLLLPPRWMPEPLLWGSIAGFTLHMAALATPLRQRGELPAPVFTQRASAWQSFWGSIGIMALGQALMGGTSLVDQFFAAGLGAGALSTVSYADRILALVLGLGATAIGRATLPVFSEAHTRDSALASRLALQWGTVIFFCGCAVSLIGWMASPWVVALVFERGAFTPHNTQVVAEFLRITLFQVPFYFARYVFFSILATQGHHRLIALDGVFNLLIKCTIIMSLIDPLQIKALAISTVAMHAITTTILYIFIRLKAK